MRRTDGRCGWMGCLVSLAAIVMSVPTVANAGVGAWTTGGPYGGMVDALAIDPVTPATLYAGTLDGVFKSTDAAGTWVALNTGLPSSPAVRALALDPTGATILHAGLWQGGAWQLRGSTDFYTVTPCRVFDTRDALLGGPTPRPAGSTTTVPIARHCGIPEGATAGAFNVTVTGPSAAGHLTLFPEGAPQPPVSVINFAAGETRASNAVARLGSSGALSVFVGQEAGSVHVIIDVNGYFR